MKNENKIIDLFGKTNKPAKAEIKYSALLEQFMNKFSSEFNELEYVEDIMEISIHAWNLANIKSISKGIRMDELLSTIDNGMKFAPLLERMIEEKLKNFNDYPLYIADYELKDVNGESVLRVQTLSAEEYLAEFEDEFSEEYYSENFINRSAIVLKPLEPFLDWINQLPDNFTIDKIDENNIYLVSEDIEDVEAWLRKKFDRLFQMELEEWWTDKKKWPQGRTYKMFKQWFEISISSMIFDMERTPIIKG